MAIKEFEIGHKFGPYEITYDEKSSDAYSKAIKNRDIRDKALKSPRLLLQSLQVNIDAGKLPVKEQNKQRYLKIPINQK